MKQLLCSMVLGLFVFLNNQANANSSLDQANEISQFQLIKVNITLTSKEGCKFHIEGDYSWGGGFSGTVTASGPGDCPNDKWTFGIIMHDNDRPELLGDIEAVNFFNANPELLNQLLEALYRQAD